MASKTLSEYINDKKQLPSNFDEVLLAELLKRAAPEKLNAFVVGAIATGIIAAVDITQPMRVTKMRAKANVCGTATDTRVMAKKVAKAAQYAAGVDVFAAPIIIDNADPDGTEKEAGAFHATDANRDLNPGDALIIEVTAAPTAGSGLLVSVEMEPRLDV